MLDILNIRYRCEGGRYHVTVDEFPGVAVADKPDRDTAEMAIERALREWLGRGDFFARKVVHHATQFVFPGPPPK